ncbi:glycosyltransferase, partial [Albidovulum sp.]
PVPRFPPRSARRRPAPARRPLGEILLEMEAVAPENLLRAVTLRAREEARLGDILLARGWVAEADLMAALCRQWDAQEVDLAAAPPDPRLVDRLGLDLCLGEAVVPWRRMGDVTVVATARPENFARLAPLLADRLGPVAMALAGERAIEAALVGARRTALIRRAETRVPAAESCRRSHRTAAADLALVALAALAALAVLMPFALFSLLAGWAVLTLAAVTGLKAAAFASEIRARRRAPTGAPTGAPPPAPPAPLGRLPVVSVLVPLFREDDIAPRLIRRLGRIDYPKELLDILLVVEEGDAATRSALARRALPRWMRVVTVPDGPLRTKPRALNYALNFCRGTIIGVWDAEDAPEPGQIHKVVRAFRSAPPEVVCLQGILDFYNSRHNWLTRCFTVEYASWFRVVLPGVARLGLVVPLGGTTLFFRRDKLEEIGGWDAHNVTEDADLGVRLARHGYRTALIDTVTEEEPNARLVSWIRQRSRWQKGFAITWATHMRDPARLWRELGPRRFLSVQILFLCALSQAVLAPLLWSFWALFFALPHPLGAALPGGAIAGLAALFVLAEALNIAIGLVATRGPGHRHLRKWVPSLYFYHPLAAFSSYKALYEWIASPFYWDKTRHGAVHGPTDEAELLPVLVLADPVAVPETAPEGAEIIGFPGAAAARPAARLHLFAPAADRATDARPEP